MKKLILLLFAFMLFSCTTTSFKNNEEESIIINLDTLEGNNKTVIEISKCEMDIIDTFRPAVKDMVMYIKAHQNEININGFHFKCGKYSMWIANDYGAFKMESPLNIRFTEPEKKYLWGIYIYARDNYKTYDWENKIQIINK